MEVKQAMMGAAITQYQTAILSNAFLQNREFFFKFHRSICYNFFYFLVGSFVNWQSIKKFKGKLKLIHLSSLNE